MTDRLVTISTDPRNEAADRLVTIRAVVSDGGIFHVEIRQEEAPPPPRRCPRRVNGVLSLIRQALRRARGGGRA